MITIALEKKIMRDDSTSFMLKLSNSPLTKSMRQTFLPNYSVSPSTLAYVNDEG